jgi:hypothetical protein
MRERGLEPLSLSAADPKSAAYTSSATPAGTKTATAGSQYFRTLYRDRHPTHTNAGPPFLLTKSARLAVPKVRACAADWLTRIRVASNQVIVLRTRVRPSTAVQFCGYRPTSSDTALVPPSLPTSYTRKVTTSPVFTFDSTASRSAVVRRSRLGPGFSTCTRIVLSAKIF